ncbi:MAG: hypothetical protein JOZ88_09975 [Hyphomicrobiales bacterium]|nr:hypothetical protein [Hyphomicrobiales bacterium]
MQIGPWRFCVFYVAIVFVIVHLAPPASAGPAQNDAATEELMHVFNDICLRKFPDDAKIAIDAEERHFTPLSRDMVAKMLGKDPGVGWIQKGGFGDYVITIEQPPFHTCAIRKQFAQSPDIHERFAGTLETWRTSRPGAKIAERPGQSAAVGGIVSQVYPFEMSVSSNRSESLIAIITPRGDITEVRLVRAIGGL